LGSNVLNLETKSGDLRQYIAEVTQTKRVNDIPLLIKQL